MTIQLAPLLERMAMEENFDVMGGGTGYFHKLNNLKMAAALTTPLPMSFSALLASRFHHQEQRTEKEDSSVNSTIHPWLAGDAK